MPTVVLSTEEFCRLHGAVISVTPDEQIFRTGARLLRSFNLTQPPAQIEPPAETLPRLQIQKLWETKFLECVRQAFTTAKASLLGGSVAEPREWSASLFGEAPSDGKGALLHLQRLHSEHRATLAEIEKEIEEQPEVVCQRQREESARQAQAAEAARMASLKAEISQITLEDEK